MRMGRQPQGVAVVIIDSREKKLGDLRKGRDLDLEMRKWGKSGEPVISRFPSPRAVATL